MPGMIMKKKKVQEPNFDKDLGSSSALEAQEKNQWLYLFTIIKYAFSSC